MGLGQKFQFLNEKKDQKVPGPGTYSDVNPSSIVSVSKSAHKNINGTGFGCSTKQNDKLQYHGMERNFYGRNDDRGPGAY